MTDETITETEVKTEEDSTAIVPVSTAELNNESLTLINQIIAEQDTGKLKDLTYLFNINQNKKTIARVNKFSDVMDALADQMYVRVTTKPDNMSNVELVNSMKTIQELIDKSTKNVLGQAESPLIQINQQNIETNVGGKPGNLTHESRDKVSNAVADILKALSGSNIDNQPEVPIDVELSPEGEVIDTTLEDNEDDD